MDQDLFEDTPIHQDEAPQVQYAHEENDEFDFTEGNYQAPSSGLQQGSGSNAWVSQNYGSQRSFEVEVDDEATQKIREEEQRIQEELRKKSEVEYQQKQERKERGRKLLQEFQEKKQREKEERQRENREKEAKRIKQSTTAQEVTGWKKVANNVPLKQGEHPGKKEVNRMRESILNKRNDES